MDAAGGKKPGDGEQDADAHAAEIQRRLKRIAHMFAEYRDDQLMRELCRLAIKVAQERLIRV